LALPGLPSYLSKFASREDEFFDSDNIQKHNILGPHAYGAQNLAIMDTRYVMPSGGGIKREFRCLPVRSSWLHKLLKFDIETRSYSDMMNKFLDSVGLYREFDFTRLEMTASKTSSDPISIVFKKRMLYEVAIHDGYELKEIGLKDDDLRQFKVLRSLASHTLRWFGSLYGLRIDRDIYTKPLFDIHKLSSMILTMRMKIGPKSAIRKERFFQLKNNIQKHNLLGPHAYAAQNLAIMDTRYVMPSGGGIKREFRCLPVRSSWLHKLDLLKPISLLFTKPLDSCRHCTTTSI
nr:enhancer of polycomb-like, N-terminal [Tanacetum cinerariifolium]